MRSRASHRRIPLTLTSFLLLALLLRALIPAGFMPSTERPFTLRICPDGFPAALLQASQPMHHAGMHGEHAEHAAHAAHAMHAHHGVQGMEASQDAADSSHDRHSAQSTEQCLFGAALGAWLTSHAPLTAAVYEPRVILPAQPTSSILRAPGLRLAQPRAPPSFS